MVHFQSILRDSRLSLVEMHRLSGVSLNTLRALSHGRNVNPRRATRAKLAAALRQHSHTLAALADQLDAD